MEVLIATHRHLIEAWMLVMGLNLLVPYALRSQLQRRVFWTRVGYFAFWAFWSMAIFSGLMVWIFAGRPWNFAVASMVGASVILAFLEGFRAIRQRRLWLAGQEGVGFAMAVVAIEIGLTTLVTLLAVR